MSVTLVKPENMRKTRLKKRTPRYSPPSAMLSGLRVVRKKVVAEMMATMAHCAGKAEHATIRHAYRKRIHLRKVCCVLRAIFRSGNIL